MLKRGEYTVSINIKEIQYLNETITFTLYPGSDHDLMRDDYVDISSIIKTFFNTYRY